MIIIPAFTDDGSVIALNGSKKFVLDSYEEVEPLNLTFIVWSKRNMNIRAKLVLLNENADFELVTKDSGTSNTLQVDFKMHSLRS